MFLFSFCSIDHFSFVHLVILAALKYINGACMFLCYICLATNKALKEFKGWVNSSSTLLLDIRIWCVAKVKHLWLGNILGNSQPFHCRWRELNPLRKLAFQLLHWSYIDKITNVKSVVVQDCQIYNSLKYFFHLFSYYPHWQRSQKSSNSVDLNWSIDFAEKKSCHALKAPLFPAGVASFNRNRYRHFNMLEGSTATKLQKIIVEKHRNSSHCESLDTFCIAIKWKQRQQYKNHGLQISFKYCLKDFNKSLTSSQVKG